MPGVFVYQVTDTGLAAQIIASGTKFFRDHAMNEIATNTAGSAAYLLARRHRPAPPSIAGPQSHGGSTTPSTPFPLGSRRFSRCEVCRSGAPSLASATAVRSGSSRSRPSTDCGWQSGRRAPVASSPAEHPANTRQRATTATRAATPNARRRCLRSAQRRWTHGRPGSSDLAHHRRRHARRRMTGEPACAHCPRTRRSSKGS